MGSSVYCGFQITRGIRQGCPFSPRLFAAISELLLRRLRVSFFETVNRAWADDLAMVMKNGVARLGSIHSLFQDFARISGLHINTAKTVLVPLFPFDALALRAIICRVAPAWNGINICTAAKYLGLMVGPGKADSSWEAPLAKLGHRATIWGRLGFGMLLTIRSYRVYMLQSCSLSANWRTCPKPSRVLNAQPVAACSLAPTIGLHLGF